MMVHILRGADEQGKRIEDDVEESQLIKMEGIVDNENETARIVEYCLAGCEGSAHRTNLPDAPTHFCNRHVHRSVHVKLKKLPEGMEAIAQSLI